eukprot:365478_1
MPKHNNAKKKKHKKRKRTNVQKRNSTITKRRTFRKQGESILNVLANKLNTLGFYYRNKKNQLIQLRKRHNALLSEKRKLSISNQQQLQLVQQQRKKLEEKKQKHQNLHKQYEELKSKYDANKQTQQNLNKQYEDLKSKYDELKSKQEMFKMMKINVLWQWQDEYNEWYLYTNDIIQQLENIKHNSNIVLTYYCKQNGQTYTVKKLSPSSAIQTNQITLVQRNVRRIEKSIKYPIFWHEKYCNDQNNYSKCTLQSMNWNKNLEAQKIKDLFCATMNHVCIKKIECVQNKYMWDKYCNAKQMLINCIGENNINEKYLFHGTTSDTVELITNAGFRKEFSLIQLYGAGTYFAKDAKKSDVYSAVDINGFKKMLICKVICGEMSVGTSGTKLTNWPKKSNGFIYDSLVNQMNCSSIFVIHDDARAYPMFVIQYK